MKPMVSSIHVVSSTAPERRNISQGERAAAAAARSRAANGSVDDIAGVCNAGRNVVGLMPHPERASDPLLGSADGVVLLEALLASALTSAGARVA